MASGKVLIVGAEENPVLPIVESLTRAGLKVHVAGHRRVSGGFFSRYVEKRFLYPSPYTDQDGFIASLLDYVRHEQFDVTLVLGDRATDLLSQNKDKFAENTKMPLVDFNKYVCCRDKTITMRLADKIGIPTPTTYYPDELGIESLAERVKYPAVLKPNSSDGARGISYPKCPEELITLYNKTREVYGPCHVQDYIPQTGMQYKAEVLMDYSGEVRAWCVYNKLRYYPITGGSSTLNSTVDRRDILALAAKILKEMKWYGMGDCDFIEDPRDGLPKLMEINPRFTRSIKICVMSGVDFPLLLYKMAMGQTFPPVLDYKTGIYLRYLPGDIMWFIQSRQRFHAKPSFFWCFGKDLNDEMFSLRNPGPAVAYFITKAASLFNKDEKQYHLRRKAPYDPA